MRQPIRGAVIWLSIATVIILIGALCVLVSRPHYAKELIYRALPEVQHLTASNARGQNNAGEVARGEGANALVQLVASQTPLPDEGTWVPYDDEMIGLQIRRPAGWYVEEDPDFEGPVVSFTGFQRRVIISEQPLPHIGLADEGRGGCRLDILVAVASSAESAADLVAKSDLLGGEPLPLVLPAGTAQVFAPATDPDKSGDLRTETRLARDNVVYSLYTMTPPGRTDCMRVYARMIRSLNLQDGELRLQDVLPSGNPTNMARFLKLPFLQTDGINVQQGWFYTWQSSKHEGIDYVKGQIDRSPWSAFQVRAAAGGVAIYTGGCNDNDPSCNTGWGNYVRIKHTVNNIVYYTLYAHLQSSPIATDRWVTVKEGDVIGTTGKTGRANGVNHLHFEFSRTAYGLGYRFDPYDLYRTREAYYPGGSQYRGLGQYPAFTTDPPSYPDLSNATVTVRRVWTTDSNGNAKADFRPGEPIQYRAEIHNSRSTPVYAYFEWRATGPSTLFSWSGYLGIPGGTSWWGTGTVTLPLDTPPGTYTFRVSSNYNGGTSSQSSTFSVQVASCPVYRAEYYGNRFLSGSPTFVRCEDWPINHNWGTGGPGSGVGSDNFSARWTGRAYIAAGTYTFTGGADDGIRVWLDGSLIIDQWRDQGYTEYRTTRTFSSGGYHDIKVEYYENGGDARVFFRWQQTSSGSTYSRLTAKHSGRCMDVCGASRDSGAAVIQWDCHNGDNQAWNLVPVGNDYYKLVAKHSGKCLDVYGASRDNGARLIQWDCHGGDNQLFRLEQFGSYYRLRAKHSGRCVDVYGAQRDNGVRLIQWDCHNGDNQLWLIQSRTADAPSGGADSMLAPVAEEHILPDSDASVVAVIEHTVEEGDSLDSIIKVYEVSLETILDANPGLTERSALQPGMTIRIPVSVPREQPGPSSRGTD